MGRLEWLGAATTIQTKTKQAINQAMSSHSDQFDLFEPRAIARRTDPETSHEAADSVIRIRERQRVILDLFWKFGAMTHEELIERYEASPSLPTQSVSGIRTRCSELVKLGKLSDSGIRKQTKSGRSTIVWTPRI